MSSHSTITARLILCHGMTEHLETKHGVTAEAKQTERLSGRQNTKTKGEQSPA